MIKLEGKKTLFISPPLTTTSGPSSWRINRTTKGLGQLVKYVDEVYLSSVDLPASPSSASSQLAYLVELETDLYSGDMTCNDPRAGAAKFKTYNDDNLSYNMTMSSDRAHQWKSAMIIEVKGILKQRTWEPIGRNKLPKEKPILPGTWALKLKRLPDGSPLKFKATYCVRGYEQITGVD